MRVLSASALGGLVLLAFLAHDGQAQQNLFNVPSAEITIPGGVFFQQQFNFNKISQSNTTIDFGFEDDWEFGINFLDVILTPETVNGDLTFQSLIEPDLLFNVQKGIQLSDATKIGIGTQIGQNVNIIRSQRKFVNFTWGTLAWELPEERGKLYAGAYYGNPSYVGSGQNFGFMLGTEIPIVEKKFHLMADYLSGNSGVSVGVVGGVFYLSGGWSVSLGTQFPSPHSGNAWGGVLEITLTPIGPNGHTKPGPLHVSVTDE